MSGYAELLAQAQAYLHLHEKSEHIDDVLKTAWGDFVLVADARLRRLVAATELPEDRREDVVRDVWLEIVKGLHRFEGDHAVPQLYRWMQKVVRSKAAREIRYLSTHPAGSLNALTAATEPENRRASTSADQEEKNKLVQVWMETLREKDPLNWRLLRGRFFEDRSVADMAAEEGLTANAVSGRIKRLKAQLRVWMEKRWGEGAESS